MASDGEQNRMNAWSGAEGELKEETGVWPQRDRSHAALDMLTHASREFIWVWTLGEPRIGRAGWQVWAVWGKVQSKPIRLCKYWGSPSEDFGDEMELSTPRKLLEKKRDPWGGRDLFPQMFLKTTQSLPVLVLTSSQNKLWGFSREFICVWACWIKLF